MKSFFKGSVSLVVLTAVTGTTKSYAALDELVVTARKRTENLQDVPLSVQAFSGEQLAKQGLKNLEDYARLIPSLTYSAWQPGASIVVFRGVTTTAESFNGTSSTALYLDEMPIQSEGTNPEVRLVDMERLEAVSGPQPTTYGASSQSGTLKYVTKKPDLAEFGGFVDTSLSFMEEGEESYDINGAINIPIVEDKFAIRLVGFQSKEGGYVDNVRGSSADTHAFFRPGENAAFDFAFDPNSGVSPATRTNINNADVTEDDIGDVETTGGRLSAKLQINDDWSVTAMAMFQNMDVDGFDSFDPSIGDLKQVRFKKESRKDDWYLSTLTFEGDLGFADFTASSGYMKREIVYNLDTSAYNQQFAKDGMYLNAQDVYNAFRASSNPAQYSATAYTAYNASYMMGISSWSPSISFGAYSAAYVATGFKDVRALSTNDDEQKRFSQELRLTSKDTGRFSWMAGAFYEKYEEEFTFRSKVDDFDESLAGYLIANYYSVEVGEPGVNYFGFSSEDQEQWAVFGELGYDITDRLNLLIGARYFEVEQENRYLGISSDGNAAFACSFVDPTDEDSGCLTDGAGNPLPKSESSKESGVTTLITATYEVNDDVLTYFTRSEGFRAGGVNILRPASTAPRRYDSDLVTNYELGVKSTLWDGRAILNVSLYRMIWEDMQLNVEDPTLDFGFSSILVNAGEAEIDGVEINGSIELTDSFKIDGALSYVDATVTEDVTLAGAQIVRKGDELPLSPDWKISFGAEYGFPVANFDSDGYVRFDYTYVGEQLNATRGSLLLTSSETNRSSIVTQPEYDIGSLTLGMENESWSMSLAVNNIWDERPVLFTPPQFGDGRVYTARPREFTVNFRKNF